MTVERFGIIKFKGNEVTVVGPDLEPGQPAPEFTVQGLDWAPFKGLADTNGKVRIIAAVPSLDTEVCDRETRRFNQEAAALSKDIVIGHQHGSAVCSKTLVRRGRRGPGEGTL
jgi:thiol peroxidase